VTYYHLLQTLLQMNCVSELKNTTSHLMPVIINMLRQQSFLILDDI